MITDWTRPRASGSDRSRVGQAFAVATPVNSRSAVRAVVSVLVAVVAVDHRAA
ncbi:hypothetical protein ACWD7F_12745 [Streptomyces sp. NPDC005122]